MAKKKNSRRSNSTSDSSQFYLILFGAFIIISVASLLGIWKLHNGTEENRETSKDVKSAVASNLIRMINASSGAGNSTNNTASSVYNLQSGYSNTILLVSISMKNKTSVPAILKVSTDTGATLRYYGGSYSYKDKTIGESTYYLLNPPLGAHKISISLSSPASYVAISSVLSGVNQTTPLGSYVSNWGTSSIKTNNYNFGDLIFDHIALGKGSCILNPVAPQQALIYRYTDQLSAGVSQRNSFLSQIISSGLISQAYAITVPTVSESWTVKSCADGNISSNDFVYMIGTLKPAAAIGSPWSQPPKCTTNVQCPSESYCVSGVCQKVTKQILTPTPVWK